MAGDKREARLFSSWPGVSRPSTPFIGNIARTWITGTKSGDDDFSSSVLSLMSIGRRGRGLSRASSLRHGRDIGAKRSLVALPGHGALYDQRMQARACQARAQTSKRVLLLPPSRTFLKRVSFGDNPLPPRVLW